MTDWRDQAACLGMDTETFFAPAGSQDRADAIAVCKSCTVPRECLQDALTVPWKEDRGIRGGLTEDARKKMRSPTPQPRESKSLPKQPRKTRREGCSAPGCGRPHWARGYCSSHYAMFRVQQVEAGTWQRLK